MQESDQKSYIYIYNTRSGTEAKQWHEQTSYILTETEIEIKQMLDRIHIYETGIKTK